MSHHDWYPMVCPVCGQTSNYVLKEPFPAELPCLALNCDCTYLFTTDDMVAAYRHIEDAHDLLDATKPTEHVDAAADPL